jgi:FHA domain-containing protein
MSTHSMMPPNGFQSDRTVLFPRRESSGLDDRMPSEAPAQLKVGTSRRRQFLVKVNGVKRRILEFTPEATEVTLGSGPAVRCRLSGEGVADLHAALVRRVNRGVYLVSLARDARTLLNGEPVGEEMLLMDGDKITLGDGVELEYQDGPRPAKSRVAWAKRALFSATGLDRIL